MPRVIHFEIHADNPERAVAFYQTTLGWKFQKWDGPMPFWLICTGDGRGFVGGLVPRRGPAPAEGQPMNGFPCTVDTANLVALIPTIESAGGKCVIPTMAIPGVGWLAYFKDTEGNIFGALQNDPAAK